MRISRRRFRLRTPSRRVVASIVELAAFVALAYGAWLWFHPLGIVVGAVLAWIVAQEIEGEDEA